jgi:tetratricopeptide (TPR) repeat protein
MNRWHPYFSLDWLWTAIIIALLVNLVSAYLMQDDVLRWWLPYSRWILAALLLLLVARIAAGVRYRRHEKRTAFALLTEAPKLRPEVLNFQPVRWGRRRNLNQRPYHQFYVPRRVTDYESRLGASQTVYDETHLVQMLRDGKGFLLVGPPEDGKTRTLFSVVTQMTGHMVVMPDSRQFPPEEAFALLKGQNVILLLDDLSGYVSEAVGLFRFTQSLSAAGASWVVAGTCLDGSELSSVRRALLHVSAAIPHRKLLPMHPQEKRQLAESIGKPWDPLQSGMYPTPGSIVLEDYVEKMRLRYQNLTNESQDVLHALKLLDTAGVLPYTPARVQVVWEGVFHRAAHFDDCVKELVNSSFLHRSEHPQPLQPEPGYLKDEKVVPYPHHGGAMHADFPALITILDVAKDSNGLLCLARAFYQRTDITQVKACVDKAALLQPNLVSLLLEEAKNLSEQGHYEDAVAAYDYVLLLRPDDAATWSNKGSNLTDLGRYEEALAAHERSLTLQPDAAVTWSNKGVSLAHLGRYEEALAAYERSLTLRPGHAATWRNKARVLTALARLPEAEEARILAHQLEKKQAMTDMKNTTDKSSYHSST